MRAIAPAQTRARSSPPAAPVRNAARFPLRNPAPPCEVWFCRLTCAQILTQRREGAKTQRCRLGVSKMVVTLALIPAFSLGEGESFAGFLRCRAVEIAERRPA